MGSVGPLVVLEGYPPPDADPSLRELGTRFVVFHMAKGSCFVLPSEGGRDSKCNEKPSKRHETARPDGAAQIDANT